MSTFEKLYAIFAVLFGIVLISGLILLPEMRQLHFLLPASGLGLIVNVLLMFIVFRDIVLRPFSSKKERFIWGGVLLLFWPAIVVYLPLHGFRSR